MKNIKSEDLKKLYNTDGCYAWMNILDERDSLSPVFSVFKGKKRRVENILKFIGLVNFGNIVDFGCGNGLLGDVVCKYARTYIGVDFSEDFISLAIERHKKLGIKNSKFECDDIVNFAQKKSEKFDSAFALDFSEHINDEEFLKIFTGIKSTLKKGASLFIHTPNGDFLLEILKKRGVLKQFEGHIGIRNDKEHLKILKEIGFSKIEVFYLPHYVLLLRMFSFLRFLPFIGKFFRARLLIKCTK